MSRSWPALGLIIAAACGRDASMPGRQSGPAPARQESVTRGTLRERILLTGQLQAERADHLTVPMTRIWQLSVRWMADDGAHVAAGAKAVEFDNSAFTAELEEKRLRLKQAALDFATEKAVAASALADKEYEVEKQKTLLEKATLVASAPRDLVAARDWQDRQLALERARVAHQKAVTELAAEKKASALALEVKQIEAEKIQRDLDVTEKGISALTLTAPREGILLAAEHPWEGRKIQVGDVVQPGWSVVELPDLAGMKVEANLSDVDDGRLAPGMRATCTLDAYPELVFPGTIREVAPVAQEMQQQSLRRAFQVVVALDRTDVERMRPGMSVKVEVLGAEVKNALLAPRAGLDLSGSQPTARLAGGGAAPVKLGACDAHRCVVTDGLAEGQKLRAGGPP